ncbi:MAG: HAMP domain-containing histidine kinase [Ignavibacteria bacterium]|jgi:two-component system phosphate regulon sensor histidine kinase PhoR|nr:HAMP domain-containing histidine kinase [Ignavibacteria bacterium]MCU7501903.1 HAMP domain-containing histidine kinase [Ignavibacteria bacterium]MCU7514751.1 HAMP domain-containing histidine kinase [Ignavibacteria bacterium]
MYKPVKKIALILILAILLPVVFLSVYELSSVNENERLIEDTFNNQLNAILFSVNQYTEDVVNGWVNKINSGLLEKNLKPENFRSAIEKLQSENPINVIFTADDLTLGNFSEFDSLKNEGTREAVKEGIKKILGQNTQKIKRLYTYKRGGYTKIEALPGVPGCFTGLMIFIPDGGAEGKIAGIGISTEDFVRSKMGPKLQEISGGRMLISVYKGKNIPVYRTDAAFRTEATQKRPIWLLPGYSLGIALKGATIEELVSYRYRLSLILVISVNLLLIAGIWLVFRSIKKEIRLAQIKSDFVSNVSHELRTPLALISMYAETLEMGRVKTEEKKKEYYGILSQEAVRLSRIVNKILSFSQIEAGRKKYSFKESDLNEVVQEVFNTYRFHMASSGFNFTFEPEEKLPGVMLDCEAVGQAVINLIDNAAKYSGDKKIIKVTTGKDQEYAFVEVRDEGIGISQEDHEHIFEKFFRVSTGDVHNVKGTGLGLTLVKHIMEAHAGKVTLKSRLGEGSTFRLSFPLIKNN